MKVVYISNSYFFDMDLSLTRELFNQDNFNYILDIPVYARKSTALDFTTDKQKAGIYPASDFDNLLEFKDFIDLTRTYIILRTSKKTYHHSNISIQLQLDKLLDRLNPDVIHVNNFLSYNYWLFLVKRGKIKKLLTVHDPIPHSGENTPKELKRRAFNYKYFDKILLLNKSQVQDFKEITGFNDKNIFLSRLGPYSYLKKISNKQKHKKNPNQVLFFGRISPYKGVEELCKSFQRVNQIYPKAQLIIAGSGNYWFDTEPYRKSSNIKFLNRFIPNDELVSLIETSAFVVCPYKDATQSGVVMSAYALNKPIIASKIAGLEEAVSHENTGLLVKPSCIEDLYINMIRLLENQNLIADMEDNIDKLNNEGYYCWREIASDIVNIYEKIK